MHGGEAGEGEEGQAHGRAAAGVDGPAALSKAWAHAEHCLPLDDVVRREVWEGSIPIRIELAKQDVCDFEQPMPFYMQVRVPGSHGGAATRLPRASSTPSFALCARCRLSTCEHGRGPFGYVWEPCDFPSCGLQAPRMAYLPLALTAAKAYFANYVMQSSNLDRSPASTIIVICDAGRPDSCPCPLFSAV